MPNSLHNLHARPLTQTAMVVLVSALLGACSGGVERFEDPIFTGNTGNQRAILNGQPVSQPEFEQIMAGPAQTAPVASATLPPPTVTRAPVTTGSIPTRPATPPRASASVPVPMAAPRPPAAVASAPRPAPAQSVRTARGEAETIMRDAAPRGVEPRTVRGWTTAGATQVSARSGDSIDSLARRYGVPKFVLGEVNGLSPDAGLRDGQRIVIPTYVHNAPNVASAARPSGAPMRLPSAGPAPTTTGSIPTAAISGLGTAVAPRPPAKPAAFRVASAAPAAAPTAPVSGGALDAGLPKAKPVSFTQSASTPAQNSSTPRTAAVPRQAPDAPRIESREEPPAEPIAVARTDAGEDVGERRFRWPARGRIISEFGTKPGGTRNEGINLALPEGADIKSAEDGTVIYSGNELKGYGNLVLVRHADGWVSAYAHNSELLVKRGDAVQRGQVIAKAGSTGSVTQPQLHFELRRGNKPVDPMRYLARL
ncbi:M23 family metallopeptidase [Stappia sp.]|uniref:M23 family metallopeptidase n=1 Tax=Stappia sp. TaxID=1870903 RepID=UPI0032D8D508